MDMAPIVWSDGREWERHMRRHSKPTRLDRLPVAVKLAILVAWAWAVIRLTLRFLCP